VTRVKKLEQEVQKLAREELAAFRDWFRKYDSDEWDRQIEEDIRAGKLDRVAQEAIAAHKAGRTKEI
jgi:KaiC/GvpD/RAD55 family RecA-like ATPase